MQEEDDDDETVVQGEWKRKYGYISEFDVDARWVLYYPNDNRPHGSLRIVSHPDLAPGYLKSFVSIVTKRRPKNQSELSHTLEQYGLFESGDMFLYKGIFYKNKTSISYYTYNNVIYKNRVYNKVNTKLIASYSEPIDQKIIFENKIYLTTPLVGDEFSVVTYDTPFSNQEINDLLKSFAGEVDAHTINETVETWENEVMDKKQNIEKLYNIKIFE